MKNIPKKKIESRKLLPRQAYKRRQILEVLITQALKDRLAGQDSPTHLSVKELIHRLKLPIDNDLEGHLLKPLRYLSNQLDGTLVSLKIGKIKSFYLNLENTCIEIRSAFLKEETD